MTLRIGTRASALATTQTGHVAAALEALGAGPVELVPVRTDGDRLRGSLATLGGTGVFVTALRDAVLDGRCDLAVHSLKDLPTGYAPGLTIAAVPQRVDPSDALCTSADRTLETLPRGARVGTGSPRRRAQLLAVRPDLDVVDIRGNVDTRLGRLADDLDAVVLAAAGLERLGRTDAVSELLTADVMLPAPGQGALAVECREGDDLAAVRALDHLSSRLSVIAERALLAALEAGCAAPVGALATVGSAETDSSSDGAHALRLEARVCALDGSAVLDGSGSQELSGDPAADAAAAARLGVDVAGELLAAGAATLAPLGPGARA